MRKKRRVILGSRGSRLAIAQAEEVRNGLRKLNPEFQFAIKKIKTNADIYPVRNFVTPLSAGDISNGVTYEAFDSKGIFTKQLDEALLRGEINLAVHSLKDVPMDLPEGLLIVAVTKRRSPADVLVTRAGLRLAQLPTGARVGTGSIRRKAQLLRVRPDLAVTEIRGNLDTRVKKLYNEEFDAIVVAQAGLERLNFRDLRAQPLAKDVMLPAAGQGSLAIEARADDENMQEMAHRLNDEASSLAVQAERTFLRTLGGGCRVPIACLGVIEGEQLRLTGAVFSKDGKHSFCGKICGRKEEAAGLGKQLAESLIVKGARKILK